MEFKSERRAGFEESFARDEDICTTPSKAWREQTSCESRWPEYMRELFLLGGLI